MNTQAMILNRITDTLQADGYIVTGDAEWNNTGTIRTFDKRLALVASVSYFFQSDYCDFGSQSDRVAALWYGKPRRDSHPEWVATDIADLIDKVTDHLRGTAPSL